MSTKKNRKFSKKHQFKQSSTNTTNIAENKSTISNNLNNNVDLNTSINNIAVGEFQYVAHDVKRVVLLAIFFVSLELVLWRLLGHTSLGNKIYNLL